MMKGWFRIRISAMIAEMKGGWQKAKSFRRMIEMCLVESEVLALALAL